MKEKHVWSRRFFEIIEKLSIWQFDVIGPFVHASYLLVVDCKFKLKALHWICHVTKARERGAIDFAHWFFPLRGGGGAVGGMLGAFKQDCNVFS